MSLILLLCFIFKLIFYYKRYEVRKNINDIEFRIKHFFGSKSKEERNKKQNKKQDQNNKIGFRNNKKGKNNKKNSFINNINTNKNNNSNKIKNNNRKILFGNQRDNKLRMRQNNNKNNSIIGESNNFKINVKNINKSSYRYFNNNRRDKKKKEKTISKRNINNQNTVNEEQKRNEKAKKIMEYIDEEKNKLPYNLALQYDKRTFCQYYISLLRTKHILFFSFCGVKDYNSKIIKMDIFFVGFTVNYTVNALFFNDDTMHKIYENKGKFNLEYEITKIVYSTMISSFKYNFEILSFI